MPTQTQAEDVLDSFDSILQVWTDNPDFKIGKFDFAAAQALNQKVDAAVALVKKKENELTGLIDDRDGVASELNELRTRALSGIRAHFGPDSTEYGRAGGTPKAIAKSPSAPKKSSPRNSPSRSGDLQSPTQNKPRAASILPHRASRSLAALLLCAVRLFGPTIANRRS